ncbi:MAG: VWA domain-containing protein [Flavobacteriales bacterium]|nr:VWA domain-containing protein [Flavobacteriales bacterium]
MKGIEFAYPWVFSLLALLLVLAIYHFRWSSRKMPVASISTLSELEKIKPSFRSRIFHLPFILRLLAMALLIVALARPQSDLSWQNVTTDGIDIIMAVDISSSMLARDFEPNRLEAAKKMASEFIENRPGDRIGLVVFARESFTQCPLTTDHAVLKNLFASIKVGMLEDGTAIGMGLANAVNRLRFSDAKSKVVILLTDGVNNQGSIAPATAAELAETMGIRVYTIGVGSEGVALSPTGKLPNGKYTYDYMKVDIDEAVLNQISSLTGGQYFRATDNNKLRSIYQQIDKLEKSKIQVTEFSRKGEEFLPFALIGLTLLMLDFLLRKSLLKSIP